MRSPTSWEAASLVMFGIRLEMLPIEASISVSPLALAVLASPAGLSVAGLSLCAASAAAGVAVTTTAGPTPAAAASVSVPDLAAGGGPLSPEHPARAIATKPTTTPSRVTVSMALTYFVAGAGDGAGVGFVAGADGAAGAGFVDGVDDVVDGAVIGAGSRTTEEERSPPSSARLKDVSVNRIATPVVILPS